MDHLRSIGFHVRSSFQNVATNPEYREDIELCPKDESNVSYTNSNHHAYQDSEKNGHVTMTNTGDVAGLPPEVTSCPRDTPTATVSGNSSTWQAGWNVANCMQGIGILSLPYTIKQGGLAALISIAAVLFIGNYTSKILVQCLYEEEHIGNGKIRRTRVRNTYSDLADEMHKYGGTLLNIMQIIDVTAVATLYLELSGSLLVDTFPYAGISKLSWIVISTVVLIPTIFFRNLTRIAWLSLIAVLSLIVMYFSVVWYSFGKSLMWDVSEIPPFQLQGFAVSSSIILFNFGTQFIMPGVEESMSNKTRFNVMVDITYFITGVLNTSYAFFAYITFGDDTKEFITYNMPLGLLQGLVSMLFVIKSLLSYPLMIFIVVNSLDAMQLSILPPCYSSNPDKRPPLWAMIFRIIIVLFTLFLAIVIPHYTLLMGVTGSLTAPWLDFIFPCLFHLKLKWNKLTGKQVFMDIIVICVALFGGIVGLFYSSKALIQAYIEDFT